eukprot:11909911-Alexandrium_andersonii.AAC.1
MCIRDRFGTAGGSRASAKGIRLRRAKMALQWAGATNPNPGPKKGTNWRGRWVLPARCSARAPVPASRRPSCW